MVEADLQIYVDRKKELLLTVAYWEGRKYEASNQNSACAWPAGQRRRGDNGHEPVPSDGQGADTI